MSTTIEHTDTFGGEANYCWAKRWHLNREMSDLALVRLAKELTGLTGIPCRREDMGDSIALYPRGICQVVFIAYAESEYAENFGHAAFPDDLTDRELRSAGLHETQTGTRNPHRAYYAMPA